MSQDPNAAAEHVPPADMDDPDPTAQWREAFGNVFEALGGVRGLADWGLANQTEFYKAFAKTLASNQPDGVSHAFVSDIPLGPELSVEAWAERVKRWEQE
jgi:hypothetical protein